MNLLLDTHVLVWGIAEPERLSIEAERAIRDPSNLVFVSIVSAWELAIKMGSGRNAGLEPNLAAWLPDMLAATGLEVLPLELSHILAIEHLPQRHRDPFDRAIIAQAQVERLTIITADRKFAAYDLPLIPAR